MSTIPMPIFPSNRISANGNVFIAIEDKYLDRIQDMTQWIIRTCSKETVDGVLRYSTPDDNIARIMIYNRDASIPEMCVNAVVASAALLRIREYPLQLIKFIDTDIPISFGNINENTAEVQVSLSNVSFDMSRFITPNLLDKTGQLLNFSFKHSNITEEILLFGVNVGNPHIVIFSEAIDSIDITRVGTIISKHPMFLNGTNIEWVEILSRNEIKIRILERGVGETSACGSGTIAVAKVLWHLDKCSSPMKINMRGGQSTLFEINANTISVTSIGIIEK